MDTGGGNISHCRSDFYPCLRRSDFLSVVTADQHMAKGQAHVKVSVLTLRELTGIKGREHCWWHRLIRRSMPNRCKCSPGGDRRRQGEVCISDGL